MNTATSILVYPSSSRLVFWMQHTNVPWRGAGAAYHRPRATLDHEKVHRALVPFLSDAPDSVSRFVPPPGAEYAHFAIPLVLVWESTAFEVSNKSVSRRAVDEFIHHSSLLLYKIQTNTNLNYRQRRGGVVGRKATSQSLGC